jgi:hypothetical protein
VSVSIRNVIDDKQVGLGFDCLGRVIVSYVQLILRLDALAARGERRDRTGYLEPFP